MGCASSTQPGATLQNGDQADKKAPAAAEPVKLTNAPNARIGEKLKDVPLFAKLSKDQRDLVGGAMEEEAYEDGEAVFAQGDAGNKFYIILSGEAGVFVKDPETGTQNKIGQCADGDYFGETALQHDAPRGASIIAKGNLQVLSLTKDKFDALVGSTGVQFVNRRIGISAEASDGAEPDNQPANAIDSHMPPPDAVREKSPEIRKLIHNAVDGTLLFSGLTDKHVDMVIDAMYRQEIKSGISPIKQGDPGTNLFIVESGDFQVFINQADAEPLLVHTQGAGTIFGELALLYNAPRAATVTASCDSVVWKVDRYLFRRIARDVGDSDLKKRVKFLGQIDLLSALTSIERSKIAEALEVVTFKANTTIIEQGAVGDEMYLVQEGEVIITKDSPDNVVNTIKAGDYVGERALLLDEPRAATACTRTFVSALVLKRHDFKVLLGPLQEIMEKRIQGYNLPPEKKDEPESYLDRSISMTDLKILGTLGKGSFGHVQLVKHTTTGETYALKAVSKQQIVDTHQQEHIVSELRVMSRLNHPFLVNLHQTYKDRDRVYFLLEPVMGGELFSLLRKRRLFKESTAKFYASNVTAAFEYLHNRNTVYRDLKPENLLLDDKGYLKITDFGFAKVISEDKTYTLCGTPDYLAPEIVSGVGHGKGADWWTLGVLIYEMVASYTPFYHSNQLKMYDKIVRGSYRFPSHFSVNVQLLIKELLQLKPTRRLGVIKGGATKIKQSKWFKGFNWTQMESQKMKAPIPIKIKNKTDMSNFDIYDDDQHLNVPVYRGDKTKWDDEF